jgi:predicted Ser/Thr protein kinase
MKTANDFIVFLRTQGYSERAIEEICKGYVCSTTENSSGKLPLESKN